MTILYLSIAATALLFIAWLVNHRNTLHKAAQRRWRGMNDKDAYAPVFIIALIIWLIILWIRGDI